jgi:beta-N-acetylhexosaminidase
MDTVPPGSDASNAPIGALDRELGHDPAAVSAHGLAFIRGMHQAGLAVVVKHFPGLGRVTANTDFAASAVDRVTGADDPYLAPFADAMAGGADMVMVSTALYTRIDAERLAAFSPTVIGLLRDRYGFQGVVVADDLGAAASVQSIPPGKRAVDFVAAGGDLVTVKYASLVAPMAAALRARAEADPAFRRQVDAAALRVLEAKSRHGLACAG